MMQRTIGALLFLVATGVAGPAAAASVQTIYAKPGKTVRSLSDLSRGAKVDVGWAERSDMACWPANKNGYFDGSHVVYRAKVPKYSKMTIEVVPRPGVDVSLYAYTGVGVRPPPEEIRSVSCEASYLMGETKRGVTANPGKPERVTVVATRAEYDVIIGVAGANGATRGRFELRVTVEQGATESTGDTGPPPMTDVTVKPNGTVEVSGDVAAGRKVPLSWAWDSSMACFPSPKSAYFSGHQVAFKAKIPKYSTMTIELLPAAKDDLSLYAYSGVGVRPPPVERRSVSCEASYLMGETKRGVTANPGKPEKVTLVATRAEYDVVIGVAGAHGATKGKFKLRIHVESAAKGVADTGPPPVTDVAVKPNGTVEVSGDVAAGKQVPLKWAWDSSMACFPAPKQGYFDGNHVVFRAKVPKYSTMTVEVQPEPGADLSLYAYTGIGVRPPPKEVRVVSCEASYLMGETKRTVTANPGKPERVKVVATRVPYDVVIGVAGAGKATKGKFKLTIHVDSPKSQAVADTGPPPMQDVAVKPNGDVAMSGDIAGGKAVPLSWAWDSSMACFPSPKAGHFSGHHVAYRSKVPKYSTMTIELVPAPGADLSLYAYTGVGVRPPPKERRSVSCEASYAGAGGKPERVKVVATRAEYDVIIGVAGASKADAGEFTLKIHVDSAAKGVADTGPPPVQDVAVKANATVKVTGDIAGGKPLPLDWAWDSSMACFPAPKQVHFDGNHVAFRAKIPRYSTMTIELVPLSKGDDLSLYAYTGVGVRPPPKERRSVSCEASYLMGEKNFKVTSNPGKPERVKLVATRAPYDVIIGVAGAAKLAKGRFELRITVDSKK